MINRQDSSKIKKNEKNTIHDDCICSAIVKRPK